MELKFRKAVAIALFSAFSALALPACDNDGPAEDLGEEVDEAAEDTKRAVDDATD
jgi:hypothetical protein